MAVGHHLGCDRTGNTAVQFAFPENPTLEQTQSGSDHPLQRYGALKLPRRLPAAVLDLVRFRG